MVRDVNNSNDSPIKLELEEYQIQKCRLDQTVCRIMIDGKNTDNKYSLVEVFFLIMRKKRYHFINTVKKLF